ncbi:MAG: stage III sporulation protein AF [Pseudomonadota bacterium]
MSDFLRAWILNITVIIVFIMFLDTVMPGSSMKRYINVVVGLLVIIVVIEPFVLVKDYAYSFNDEFLEASGYIEQSGEGDKSQEITKYQQQQAIEIFEENLKARLAELVEKSVGGDYEEASVELEVDKDIGSKSFGSIKSVSVSLKDVRKQVIQVDRIKIGADKKGEENKNVINADKAEYNLNDSSISNEIKVAISNALGISESIVDVNVQH